MMKNFISILFISCLVACSSESPLSSEDEMTEYLTSGKWEVVEFDGEKNNLESGVVFSSDMQYFTLDSQGRIVPSNMEKVFEIKNDTLKMVDFKYKGKFLQEKGTLIFKINKLDDTELLMNSIYPDSTSVYKLKNEDW